MVFLIVAVIGSSVAQVARARATEAEQRRREADLAAEMARLLLRGNELSESLPAAAQRLATALNLPSAAIELAPIEGDERRVAFPLREGTTQLGTLVVPAGLPEEALRRLQERVVPSLEALLAAGLDRDRLLGEVGGDARAAPRGRHQDDAAARGLPRPAHTADRDRGGRRGDRLADAQRRGAARARRRDHRREHAARRG